MRKQASSRGITLRKALFALVAAGLLAVCLACVGCTSGEQEASSSSSAEVVAEDTVDIEYFDVDPTDDPMTAFAANSAAFELSGEENACYSPASYYIALAMLAAGADGEAQQQLFDALGATSTEELDDYCQGQLSEMALTSEESTIDVSNSLWSNLGYEFQTEYQEAVEKYFDAGAFDVEFGTAQTDNMIKEWISNETRGLIEPDIVTDANTVATLINTIYFKDQWVEAFTEGATATDVFHALSGDVQADFMHKTTDYGTYIEGENFTAAEMPFSGGSMCTFFLPNAGTDVAELLENPESLAALLSAEPTADAQINWSVPRFETTSSFKDLVECAEALGIVDVFNPTNEDMFRNMIVAETAKDLNFYVEDAIQETTITLDELGVEAAAYTMLGIKATALAPEAETVIDFVLDRPFAYAITAPNGAPLFIGVVVNPSA